MFKRFASHGFDTEVFCFSQNANRTLTGADFGCGNASSVMPSRAATDCSCSRRFAEARLKRFGGAFTPKNIPAVVAAVDDAITRSGVLHA